MHHRTRFITSLLTLSSATLVVGCSEHSDQPDQIATISADFAETLRSRPAVRENSSTPDDSASTLRKLAGQARSSDAAGSDLLANRIYTSAGTFDLDEAMRLESMAARLRNLARKLAANADLLADAASSAENLDISDANRMIENWRAEASSELNGAEEKLQEIQGKIDQARGQREAHLAQAAEYEAIAVELAEEGVDLGPKDGEDAINESIYFRQQADELRIKAARDDTTILTLEPTQSLAGVERDAQRAKADHARESGRMAESRVQEARAFATTIRGELDRLSTTVGQLMDESVQLEQDQIMPRLEAAIGDFEAAANAAKGLSRGGSKAESDNAWTSVANAQFSMGRCHWETGSILGRRADALARIASGGALVDPAAIRGDIEEAEAGRKQSFEAARKAFNDSIESIGRISANDARTARLRQSVEEAIATLDGTPPTAVAPTRSAGADRARGGGSSARSTGGGSATGGFGTPAEAAKFLSDPVNQMNPAALKRIKDAMRAETPQGQAAEKLLTAASVMMPLFEAMSAKFGTDKVMAAMGDASIGGAPTPTFSVDEVDGDVATLKSSDGRQTIQLVKTPNGWVYDLDKTIKDDPQAAMMIEFMGPMLDAMLKPLGTVVEEISAKVKAGDYSSPEEAMEALDAAMSDMMPGGGGGRGGGFGR